MKQSTSFNGKTRACSTLSYASDVRYESMMIERVKVKPERATCVHCGTNYQPRYIGDQICGRCANV